MAGTRPDGVRRSRVFMLVCALLFAGGYRLLGGSLRDYSTHLFFGTAILSAVAAVGFVIAGIVQLLQ